MSAALCLCLCSSGSRPAADSLPGCAPRSAPCACRWVCRPPPPPAARSAGAARPRSPAQCPASAEGQGSWEERQQAQEPQAAAQRQQGQHTHGAPTCGRHRRSSRAASAREMMQSSSAAASEARPAAGFRAAGEASGRPAGCRCLAPPPPPPKLPRTSSPTSSAPMSGPNSARRRVSWEAMEASRSCARVGPAAVQRRALQQQAATALPPSKCCALCGPLYCCTAVLPCLDAVLHIAVPSVQLAAARAAVAAAQALLQRVHKQAAGSRRETAADSWRRLAPAAAAAPEPHLCPPAPLKGKLIIGQVLLQPSGQAPALQAQHKADLRLGARGAAAVRTFVHPAKHRIQPPADTNRRRQLSPPRLRHVHAAPQALVEAVGHLARHAPQLRLDLQRRGVGERCRLSLPAASSRLHAMPPLHSSPAPPSCSAHQLREQVGQPPEELAQAVQLVADARSDQNAVDGAATGLNQHRDHVVACVE